jgi:plasmid stabilization system protein ParE
VESILRLIFSPKSLADLQRINQFYTLIEVKIARKAAAVLAEALRLILKFPQVGRFYNERRRIHEFIVPFGKGNFMIRYQFIRKRVDVLHIWHSLEDE